MSRFFFSFDFNHMSGFSFQYLKASTLSAEELWEKFSLLFLTFFNNLFTSFVEPGYLEEFIVRDVGFCNFDQNISKESHWILRQDQPVRRPRSRQCAEGLPVSPVEFPEFSRGKKNDSVYVTNYWEKMIVCTSGTDGKNDSVYVTNR